jgi:adenylate cyclase, class 2
MELRHNLEIKARLEDRDATRRTVQQIATERVGQQLQTDTYFFCRQGRLKLREIQGRPAQLIWYERPDTLEPKTSRYQLVEVGDSDTLRQLLSAAWGIRVVVKKRREIYLYRHVRIHLDHVEPLGDFLELEAVVPEGGNWDEAERLVHELLERLGISASLLMESSYSDLLLALSPPLVEDSGG